MGRDTGKGGKGAQERTHKMKVKEWLAERCQEAGLGDTASDRDLSSGFQVSVKKGAARSLKAGGAWIYDNEIDRAAEGAAAGDIVRVVDFDGFVLGYGCYNPASKIRVRMLSRHENNQVTPAFLKRRVREAWMYRRDVMGEDAQSCRIIFGEADFLPGITVDRFSDVLVIESLALGTDRLKELILLDMVEILEEDEILVRGIYERSDARVRLLEGLPRVKGFLGPEFDPVVPIVENGIRYLVDVKDGQKTGFFLDQKYNRRAVGRLVENLVRGTAPGKRQPDREALDISSGKGQPDQEALEISSGKGQPCRAALAVPSGKETPADGSQRNHPVEVLDCFTHTGSFGLNAALAGASHVLSVDASESAIEMARRNAAANGLERRITYMVADVFELLPKLEEGRFDVVILDPPAFTKSRTATKNAVKGYREINLRGMKLVKDGGYLATCSCSHFMEEELLKKTLREAARGAGRRLRQIEFRTQAPDHPILWGDEESYYLKFFIFQVLKGQ